MYWIFYCCYCILKNIPKFQTNEESNAVAASRESLLAKLDDAYTVYFDRVDAARDVPHLAAAYAFHSRNECYVLSKKAKIWSAETNEYVYVFSVPELTAGVFEECRRAAHDMGMECIHPHIEHMSSNITALFVCDSMTGEAEALLRKTRIHKNFMLSFYGWMEFRTAAVIPADGRIAVNRAGKDLSAFIRGNLEKC